MNSEPMQTKIAFAGAAEVPKAPFIYKMFGQRPMDDLALQFYRAGRIYDFLLYSIDIWDVSLALEFAKAHLRDPQDIVVACYDVNTNLNEIKNLIRFLGQQPYKPHLIIFGVILDDRCVHPLAVHTLANRLKKQNNFKSITIVDEFHARISVLQTVIKSLIVQTGKGVQRYS